MFRAAIDRRPTELWHIILTYACTNGDTTGRDLSLTSRWFSALVELVRMQSVAISSDRCLRALRDTLTQHGYRTLRIRYLTFNLPLCVPRHALFISESTQAIITRAPPKMQCLLTDLAWDQALDERGSSIAFILSIAAPTLESLVLPELADDYRWCFSPTATRYPALHTLAAPYSALKALCAGHLHSLPTRDALPCLTHLHLLQAPSL